MIHESWRLWEHLQGNFTHRHDLPYSDPEAHGGIAGPEEHELQAAKVNEILKGALPCDSLSMLMARKTPLFPAINEAELAAAYNDPDWAAFENNCAKASK